MSDRLLVLAPTFGDASALVDRALAELRELGIDTRTVDLRSDVHRVAELTTTEIAPLSGRLAAMAAHELAGDREAKLGFLGAGPLALVATAAGAQSSATDALFALFPDRVPLLPAAAPSLVIADAPSDGLGELQEAWGAGASIVLAPKDRALFGVVGVADPVSALVADFAATHLLDRVVKRGLVAWLAARGWNGQYPMTAIERRRLVERLQQELVAELAGSGRPVTPAVNRRIGRVAAVLAGLAATQLIAAHGPTDPVVTPATYNTANDTLMVSMTGADVGLDVLCNTADQAVVDGVVVMNGSAAVDCDSVDVIDVDVALATNAVAYVHVDGDGFDPMNAAETAPIRLSVDIDGTDARNQMNVVLDGEMGASIDGNRGADHIVVGSLVAEPGEDVDVAVWGSAGQDVITIGDAVAAGGDLWVDVTGSTGNDAIAIGQIVAESSGSVSVSLDGSSGSDVFRAGDVRAASSASADLDIWGSTGDDEIVVGNLLASGSYADVSVSVDGSTGNDVIAIGNAVADGYSASVSLDASGSDGNDSVVVGNVSALGDHAWADATVDGDAGNDILRVGNVRAVGESASASLSMSGSYGNDDIAVGDVAAIGSYADADVSIDGSSGINVISVGDVLASGQSASADVDLDGSDGAERFIVGDVAAIGSDADVSVSISGSYGGDSMQVGNVLASGPSAWADVSLDGYYGDDVLRVGNVLATGDDASVSVSLDGYYGDDVVQVGNVLATGTDAYVDVSLTGSEGADQLLLGDVGAVGEGASVDVYMSGDNSDDVLQIGDVLASWTGTGSTRAPDVYLDLSGNDGNDVLTVGNLSAVGSHASISLSFSGSYADDVVHIGNVLASGTAATVDVSVDLSSGSNEFHVGDLLAKGEDAYVSLSVSGDGSNDLFRVGDVVASGASAGFDVWLSGDYGRDDFLVGDVIARGENASGSLSISGSYGQDVIEVGALVASGTSAYLDVELTGYESDDHIVVGDIRAIGSSALAEVSIYASDGDDVIDLQGLSAVDSGSISLDVDAGRDDDLVRVYGPVNITGSAWTSVSFDGGDHSDTLSYAPAMVPYMTGIASVLNFENISANLSAPSTGGGGGGSSVIVPAVTSDTASGRTFEKKTLSSGQTYSTDTDGDGLADADDQVFVDVTLPQGGTVQVGQLAFIPARIDGNAATAATGVAPEHRDAEYASVQIDLDITRNGDQPATIEVHLDGSSFTPGADLSTLTVFLNGAEVPTCPTSGTTQPAVCITGIEDGPGDDIVITIESTHNSVLSFAVASTDQSALFCDDRSDGSAQFGDLAASSPHKDAAECLADADIFEGTGDGFEPGASLTRAQAASIIDRAASALGIELSTGEDAEFSDVVDGQAHAESIRRLAGAGIILGRTDGTFDGGASVTRAQFAAIMTRLFAEVTGETPTTLDVFADDDGTALEEAMNEAAALGFLEGFGGVWGGPRLEITRAQAASILARFAGRMVAAEA